MMQGSIQRFARDRVESRDDTRLPTAWVGLQRPQGAVSGLSWLADGQVAPGRPEREAPVLVMLGANEGAALNELAAHAAAGAHVYVLAAPAWGKGVVDPRLLQAPRVLVRRVPEVPATSVHTASGARLWIGGGWSLRLDPGQADALRQVFLRLFWHDATEEAWSGGRQLDWRVAGDRPFDVPELQSGASVRLLAPDARLQMDPRGALVHVATGGPPQTAPRRLWFPAGPDHHDSLSRLLRGGTEVVWEDRHLPDLVVGGSSGEVLLSGSRARLRVLLTAPQAADAARILEAPARWQFGVDLRLGDPSHATATFWLPGEAAARGIEPEQGIDVPDVPAATLRGVAEASPTSVPTPQLLALSVRFRWTVVPPRLPAGTDEDPLVGRWRKLDEDWASRLGRVREALQAADGDRGRIGRAFSQLVSAMLGFQRTHSGLLAQVASLEAERPSAAGATGAPGLLSRLVAIEDQATKLQGDLEEAERKAREDEEREKQETAWRSRVDSANRDLAARRTALSDAEGKRPHISGELSSIEAASKSADKKERKDLDAQQRKLSDDLARLNKEVGRLRAEVADLVHRTEERFEFRPPASPAARPTQRGGRFVPAGSTSRPASAVPDEALPEAGALRKHQGQRYLAIQTWEQLAAGEQAAVRLSAKLVAPENV